MSAPAVGLLLDIDREYREKAASGVLRKIAPRLFNPEHEDWLPVLHARFGSWRFTALYSNTERAHDLHRTHDWVVVRFDDDDGDDGQVTVVTEYRGALKGRRVVRGLESDCAAHYRAQAPLGMPAGISGQGGTDAMMQMMDEACRQWLETTQQLYAVPKVT